MSSKFHLDNPKHRPIRHRGDMTASVQRRYLECCQSLAEHRFDCRAVPADKRGAGPVLPVKPTSPRQLVDRVRRERIVVDEPRPGVMRVRSAP
jgi:hypothetical protein